MSQPRRKWYVLSLRGAMLLILVLGLWMGGRVNRATAQRRAVALVRHASGVVFYDHHSSGKYRT